MAKYILMNLLVIIINQKMKNYLSALEMDWSRMQLQLAQLHNGKGQA